MIAKTKTLVIMGLLLLLLPDSLWAAAEEAAHEGWGWLETIGRWFNLALLFGVVYHFAGPAIKQFFNDRRQEIQDKMKAAEKAKAEAQAKLATIEERLRNLDGELVEIRQQAERQAQVERERILEQAEQEAAKILAAAERDIHGMSQAARKELRTFAAQLAIELAERRIREKLTAEDEARMIGDFFSNLERPTGGRLS